MGGKNRKVKKISKVKRNNQTTNKLQKQGKIKNQRHHKPKPQKQPVLQQQYSDDDSEQSDNMMDMIEDDDLEYMKGNLSNGHSMKFLTSTNLEDTGNASKKKRKRRRDSDSDRENLEDQYEEDTEADKRNKKLKPLLPIKTKEGIVVRTDDQEGTSDTDDDDDDVGSLSETRQTEDSDSPGEQKADGETQLEEQEVISAADLMVARKEELQDKKFRIGTLSSSLLESPDKKVKNFYPLLTLMDEATKDGTANLISVRKLATISICEVFKDILPDYQIRHQDYSNIKLKKDTLALYKYENELLAQYKRYLQRLEKTSNMLRLKRGDNRKIALPLLKLAHISLTCLCELLVSKPYFNYATNICQTVVPFLNNKDAQARRMVSESCKSVFADDKKGEISLMIVRKINHLVKSRSNNVHTEALQCLLGLRIKDVNLDAEKEIEMKQKQEESHKKRLINMSKKEKKRNKKLQEVEKEMLETKAEENKMTKHKFLTEIIKTVFMIYFRILKNSPHSKLLSAALEGLSKYTHIINLEYYSDLVNILNFLLENDIVHYKERLHCIQTVFSILSGQGDILNIDPTKFYTYLYQSLLWVHAGKTCNNLPIVIDALNSILIKRRRKISQQILLAYVKRLATLSLQVQHNGALSCLGIIKTVAMQSKAIENLLELDESMGSGKYDSQLLEPEYCNANATSLFELARLRNHYHPTVRQFAAHIAAFVPTSGEHSLPADVGKLSPDQLLKQYDGSEMAFKPAVPPPKKGQEKKKVSAIHVYAVHTFEEYCTQKFDAVTSECDFSALCKKK